MSFKVIIEDEELFIDGKPNLKHCPMCGMLVEVHGGNEEWTPTYNDPDSGGEPYRINCKCGLEFSIGYCDITDFIERWNTRSELVSCECCRHLGENINICLSCDNRSHYESNKK